MAIDYDKLINIALPDVHQSYSSRDTLLYALSLGLGGGPMNRRELPFVYEKGQRCLPSYGAVLGRQGFWIRDMDTGVDWVKLVHTEHQLILHKPLPVEARLVSQQRVADLIDRGEGRGAVIVWERKIHDADSGEALCTVVQTMLARGDGGFGGPPGQLPPPPTTPDREPDMVVERKTADNAALLYRLNGDMNPLHADPEVARKAGFERPILHGLATWGIAATAVLDRVCDFDSDAIASVYGRFTAPVMPGETLCTRIWVEGGEAHYTVEVVERGVLAIKNGLVGLRNL
ncbi:MAG: MaoC/PaaZ C-terminal domain-containing protein [Pseudomonadota bacterium]|nr:MaoC/PaaZ C-terminal domain-containing protein [Pseudomonadota bacterium]